MKIINQIYTGANNRESLIDLEIPSGEFTDIIVFIHGFKGYKDWGTWNLVQNYFVSAGKAFCKFNISHNGGTTENPIDFPDLNAFSRNRYSYELKDVEAALDWLSKQIDLSNKRVHLIGHSRGGGIAILSAKDERISSVTTWAGVSDFGSRFPQGEDLENWRKAGSFSTKNGRTKQDMPHLYEFYEDFLANETLLNIENAAKNLSKSALHIHGDADTTVGILEAEKLSDWTEGKMFIIKEANHVFGASQPYMEDEMPNHLNEVCNLTLQFIDSSSED